MPSVSSQSSSPFANSHYAVLGLHPAASAVAVRRAYRELSKQFHPDTTALSPEVATVKFQQLNEAYAILSNPERRALYDLHIGYSRWNVIQAPPDNRSAGSAKSSAYLDPSDRPLSGGGVFCVEFVGVDVGGVSWAGDWDCVVAGGIRCLCQRLFNYF